MIWKRFFFHLYIDNPINSIYQTIRVNNAIFYTSIWLCDYTRNAQTSRPKLSIQNWIKAENATRIKKYIVKEWKILCNYCLNAALCLPVFRVFIRFIGILILSYYTIHIQAQNVYAMQVCKHMYSIGIKGTNTNPYRLHTFTHPNKDHVFMFAWILVK